MSESSTFCKDCAHCNTDEAIALPSGGAARHVLSGVCTLTLGWFNGKLVPDWLTGCPDYERAERVETVQ